MSAKPVILESLSDAELTELAWEQAALTTALAERLEMVARDKQDLLSERERNLNKLENDDE
jgi:hypothetical protein